ncbi:MAG TPA: O-antigen ligase family protein [Anaerolineales bacterium]|nr:O-antigen ligase family protein [Anaerolineales bacterium]
MPGRDVVFLLAPSIYLLVLPLAHTTALRSVSFAVSALLLVWTWRAYPATSIPMKAAFAAWFVAGLFSLFWAVRPDFSLGEVKDEILYGFLVFLIFFKATRSHYQLRLWQLVLSASGLLAGLVALVHFLRRLPPYDVGMLYGGALSYAGYMATILPTFAAITILNSGKRRIGMLCLMLFLLIMAFFTTNRGIWLYLLVELVVFAILYLMRVDMQRHARRVAAAIFAMAIIVTVGTLLWAAKSRLGMTGGPAEIIAETANADLRPHLWKDSVMWIMQRPFTGAGFGTMVLGTELQAQQQNLHHTHAHNILLNYALQLGLLGPLVVIFLFYSVGREFWKLVQSEDRELQILGIAGISMVSGVLTAGMIEDLFGRHLGWLFWALAGMTMGYARNQPRDGNRATSVQLRTHAQQ